MYKFIKVDYQNLQQSEQLMQLMQLYACDPMGGAEALSGYTQQHLIAHLEKWPTAHSFLIYQQGIAVAMANGFMGFSTFACAPLFNIHDFYVLEEHRNQGIAQYLLAGIAEFAQQQGCCKLTLEVLQHNHAAKCAYARFGFQPYQLHAEQGAAAFWQKTL